MNKRGLKIEPASEEIGCTFCTERIVIYKLSSTHPDRRLVLFLCLDCTNVLDIYFRSEET